MTRYHEELDRITSGGLVFPGTDGQAHYRFAKQQIEDSLRVERGVGPALTWLARVMPAYRALLGEADAAIFEATVRQWCEEVRR